MSSNLAGAAEDIGSFLLEHADLIPEIVDVVRSGASKESLRNAIRALKVKVSDDAFRQELDDS